MKQSEVDITSDGITVWVNSHEGLCIARFGKMGIDIHNADPMAQTECLHCTHGPVTAADWKIFQEKMKEHYGIVVSDDYLPDRFLPNPGELKT